MDVRRSDAQLIASLARGEADALTMLYERHAPAMLSSGVYVLGDAAAAEDVLHEVMLEVWRRASTYDPARGSVRAWLMVRMSSRCLDRLRVVARRMWEPVEEMRGLASADLRPDQQVASSDRDRVQAALDRLPEEQREAIVACYFDGLTTAEAAQRLGCPQGTLKSRLRLGLQGLRSRMGLGGQP